MGRGVVMRRLTHAVSTPGRLLVTTMVALLVVVLAFTGVSQTLAVWNSQATASGSATGAQLKLTTNFGNAGADFANHRTSVTGSFTLTNETVTSSGTAGHYSATIAATGAASLRAALAVTIWPRTSEGCTATATPQNVAASGTWASTPFIVSGDLAATQTHTYCMRMSATDRGQLASAGGSLVINPSINATLSIGNWSASASGSAAQSTAYIFPQHNPTAQVWYQLVNTNGSTIRCASVNGGGSLSAANCGTSTNQHLKFVATGDNYHEVVPRSVQTRRLDVSGASTTPGASVDTQNLNASRPSQDWQVQYKGDVAGKATFQVVNRNSGYCLQVSGNSYVQQECNGAATQAFTLEIRGVDVVINVSCTNAGNNVTYQWNGAAAGPYTFAFQNGTTGSYIAASPVVSSGSSSITFTPAQIGAQLAAGTNNLKVTWLGYDITAAPGGSVWKEGTGGSTRLSCSAPTLETLACVQSPPNSVNISWGHSVPAGTTYTIELVAGTGGGGNTQVAVASAGSTGRTITADNWADGTRVLKVISSAGPEVEIQVAKSGGTGNGATERLWCLTEAPVTITCNPSGNASRATSVSVSWPTGATRGDQIMLEIAGQEVEVFAAISTNTNTGMSSFSVPASSFPPNQTVAVKMTRIGDNSTGGFILGSRNFDTTADRNSFFGYIWYDNYRSRCAG